ncbi:MAG TPA: acyl--CoA ligase [Candidatus Dormibacteraeota bacterium]|nr:acyl--CoA ligase [Candidatus Dormibacteraeota bacterium]
MIRDNRFIDANLGSLLDRGATDQAAVVVPGELSLTYGRLRELTGELATALVSRGVKPGDRVATVFPNGPEAVLTFLATSMIGVSCPLNPGYKEDEFRFYLEDTGARFLLVPPDEASAARQALPAGAQLIEVELDPTGRLEISNHGGARSGSLEPADAEATALVLHTSGTTSRPKRVPLRHRNLLNSAANIVQSYQLTPDDVSLCIMPLFHVHGLVASTLATFASGGTVVVPRRYSPLGFRPLVEATRPTWFTASPTPHQLILSRIQDRRPLGCERLRFVRSCSAALAPSQMELMESVFGVPVLEAYGMTEASHQMASNPLPPDLRMPGSVGRGTGVEIAILDEAGHELPSGANGEVAVRGPNVIDAYENNPSADASSFTRGWFRTGDLGVLDTAGYLRLLSRIKELINRGGEKIAPREIDEVLEAHPAVKEAVSFGVPHPTWGEEVGAAVVLNQPVTEKELLAFARSRLADFKVPRHLHIVESIPKTPTGKIQRRFVAEQFIQP